MEVLANREIGLMIKGLLEDKYRSAGLAPPPVSVGTLGESRYTIDTKMNDYRKAHRLTGDLEAARNDPTITFYRLIIQGMIWTSTLLHQLDDGIRVVTFADERFFGFGYPQL